MIEHRIDIPSEAVEPPQCVGMNQQAAAELHGLRLFTLFGRSLQGVN